MTIRGQLSTEVGMEIKSEQVGETILTPTESISTTYSLRQPLAATARPHPHTVTTALTAAEMAICLDGSRAKRVLGFKPTKPRVQVEELRAIAQGFQKDHIW